MKKKVFILSLLLFVVTTIQSCKDFLGEKPYDFVSPENLQTSPAGVKQMVTGMYSVFFNAQMFRNEAWIYLTICDDDWTSGLDWVMGTYGVGNFKGGWIYNNPGNDPYYVFYRMIRAANAVLEVLPGVNFSPEDRQLKQQYEGEALTMRAFAYFYLVQMYGALPLKLRTDDPDNMPRSPIVDVYNQILVDLRMAEDKLFLNSQRPSVIKRGHFTKGAAQLLMAKVYNTMGSGSLTSGEITSAIRLSKNASSELVREEQTFSKNKVAGYDFDSKLAYDSAKVVVKRLMDTREYEMQRFGPTWNPANYGGTEFVFALETDSMYAQATTSFNRFFTPPGLKGQGWLRYAKDLYYLYDAQDDRGRHGVAREFKSGNLMTNGVWRRQFFPAEDSLYYYDRYGRNNVLTSLTDNNCYLMKWYVGDPSNPNVLLNQNDAGTIITTPTQNLPLLRYTEAYLILAEAENELNGPTAIAYDALDEIRRYRFVQGSPDISRTMNQQQLRSFILEERTREFIGEGYRRFDLIRWGIYLQVMNAVDHRAPHLHSQDQIVSKRREAMHLLYPVPTIEIDGNTLFGSNNPGW